VVWYGTKELDFLVGGGGRGLRIYEIFDGWMFRVFLEKLGSGSVVEKIYLLYFIVRLHGS